MELTNDFEVAVPVEEAWAVLTDLERIAPCMPGAELKEVEGDEYRGAVKVKVGPITASYRGAARFEELNLENRRAVLKADGRETRGQGNASATITATLSESDSGTKVHVATEIAITGKVAQFGRGVLADVSGKLLDQFVHNLETMVLAPGAGEPAAPPAAGETTPAVETETIPAVDKDTTPAVETDTTPAAGEATPAVAGDKDTTPAVETERTPAVDKDTTPAVETERTPAVAGDTTVATAGDANPLDSTAAPEGSSEPQVSSIRQIQSAPAEPVELLSVAGSSVAKRMVPFASVAGILVLIRIVIYAMKRRKR